MNKMILANLLFFFTLLGGLLLAKSGQPYSAMLINLHRILALIFLVYIGIQLRQHFEIVGFNGALLMLTAGVIAMAIVVLFASGAMMSMRDERESIFVTLHLIGNILLMASYTYIFIEVFYKKSKGQS